MIYAGEQCIAAASKPYRLLGKEGNLRHIYRYGQHHGFVDITTYFDWFDKAFGWSSGVADVSFPSHLVLLTSAFLLIWCC
jgi:hypothetical protein